MRWRSQAIEACKNGDYDMAVNSLAAINALLPAGEEPDGSDGFKVEISTEKYNEIMRERKTIECNYCKEECILSNVKQQDIVLGWEERILSCKESERIWVCTSCGKQNILDINDIKIRKYQEPFYTKIIPSPPVQERGVRGRNIFPKLFNVWFGIAVAEIENQIGLYRSKYMAQQDEDEEITGDD